MNKFKKIFFQKILNLKKIKITLDKFKNSFDKLSKKEKKKK